MRNTGGSVDTLPPKDIYSVNSLMATSRNEYEDVENNHTTDYWISEMDKAIDENGLLVYLFHGIEDGKTYIYANVVPDEEAAVICEAKDTEYAKSKSNICNSKTRYLYL